MYDKERYALRKSQHRCTRCGETDEKTLSGKLLCAQCKARRMADREERNEYNRKLAAVRRESGLCTRCGKEDAFTMNGRSMCADCAERARAAKAKQYANEDRKQTMYAQHRGYQQKRREAGLCPTCGRPATPGYKSCPYCRAKRRNWMREYRGTSQCGVDGMCALCGKQESLPGLHVCQACYDRIAKFSEKGRDTIEKMKADGWVHPWKRHNDVNFGGPAHVQ